MDAREQATEFPVFFIEARNCSWLSLWRIFGEEDPALMTPKGDALPKGKIIFRLAGASVDALQALQKRLSLDYSDVETLSPVLAPEGEANGKGSHTPRFVQWVSLQLPIFLHEVVESYHFSRKLETLFAARGPEYRVAITPGYLSAAKVVLVSAEDAPHRIFLGRGVYGEPLLRLSVDGQIEPWSWTAPEVCTPETAEFFGQTLQRFLEQSELSPSPVP